MRMGNSSHFFTGLAVKKPEREELRTSGICMPCPPCFDSLTSKFSQILSSTLKNLINAFLFQIPPHAQKEAC